MVKFLKGNDYIFFIIDTQNSLYIVSVEQCLLSLLTMTKS